MREVVIDFTIRMVMEVEDNNTPENIDFYYSGSTWCVDNLLDEIQRWEERTDNCLCGITKAKYIREATDSDKEHFLSSNHLLLK